MYDGCYILSYMYNLIYQLKFLLINNINTFSRNIRNGKTHQGNRDVREYKKPISINEKL